METQTETQYSRARRAYCITLHGATLDDIVWTFGLPDRAAARDLVDEGRRLSNEQRAALLSS